MRDIGLSDISSGDVASTARVLVDLLRTGNPRLDLRRGTVLRDLLVDADAAVGAWYSRQAEEQRLSSSLLELSRRAEAGESVDPDDVSAILSNFGLSSGGGSRARGKVMVVVSSGVDHSVLSGFKFRTADGATFSVSSDTRASTSPGASDVRLHAGQAGTNWWFLVPVESDDVGSAGNLVQGTALDAVSVISDFVSASAYADFSNGSDVEDLKSAVSRIAPSLSARGLTTGPAVEARLRDAFDSSGSPIVAVSVCGYGNPAQLRDRHNVFGVSVGGRVDVYVRNFSALPVEALDTVEGMKVPWSDREDGSCSYALELSHADLPGMMSVESVSDAGSMSLSSYAHFESWHGDVSSRPWGWHDIDAGVSRGYVELANTAWRDVSITVGGVVPTDSERESGRKLFKVLVSTLPMSTDIQAFLDDGEVRNSGCDFVARGPVVVNVSVNAVVRHGRDVSFDVGKAVSAVCSYVNSTGFVGRLTRSEIASVLIGLGATSVDMPDGPGGPSMLSGRACAADGSTVWLSGDALDVSSVEDPAMLVTPDTCVFVAEPGNVRVSAVVE